MFETQPCAILLAGELTRFYAFLTSDAGQLFFAALAAVRATIYYCEHSRYPEARELAAAMMIGSALALLIAAEQSRIPMVAKEILTCKSRGEQERVAFQGTPKAGEDH